MERHLRHHLLYSSVESTSRYEMRVLKVITDHETTNREKPRFWHKHGKITKHVVQWESGVIWDTDSITRWQCMNACKQHLQSNHMWIQHPASSSTQSSPWPEKDAYFHDGYSRAPPRTVKALAHEDPVIEPQIPPRTYIIFGHYVCFSIYLLHLSSSLSFFIAIFLTLFLSRMIP